MKSKHNISLLSDKDLQLIKITYRSVIQNYYDNPNDQNAYHIILINTLARQTISTTQQSDAVLLISVLQVLKVKAKANKELVDSIQTTIIHMKNPLRISLKSQTLQQVLDVIELFPLSCTIILRFFESEMISRINQFDWKEIITKISKNCDKNMLLGLQVLVLLLPHFQNMIKVVSKSGIIKYICSVYLLQVLADKNTLYKALKLLKIISVNDRTVLLNRQKNLASVIYEHPRYILVVREIADNCFDSEYCSKILNHNHLDIDQVFLWSYNTNFCALADNRTINSLEQMISNDKNITAETQWKIYSTLQNLIKSSKNLNLKKIPQIPKHSQKNLNVYLKLTIADIESRPQTFNKIDIKAIQYVYDKSKTTDPVSVQLIKQLKKLDPSLKHKKVSNLPSSLIQLFSFESNPDQLMENAMKVPKNKQETKFIQQILAQKPKNVGQFQNDMMKIIKSKALDSLRQSIIARININFPDIVNHINLDSTGNPEDLDKVIKMMELYLTMNPNDAHLFDSNKFLKLLEHLENNHGDANIDWVAAGQVLTFLFGPDQWKKHINQIPDRCFWLLNATDSQLNDQLIKKFNSLSVNHKKQPIIIGFISKTNDQNLKKLLLQKTQLVDNVIKSIAANGISNSNLKTSNFSLMQSQSQQNKSQLQKFNLYNRNVINLSYLIQKWDQSKSISKKLESNVIVPVLNCFYKCFLGTDQQLRFLENCLPHKLDLNRLQDMNVAKMIEMHGKLASYLHKNKYPGKIDYSVIQGLTSQTDPSKINSALIFLTQNPDFIEGQDYKMLLNKILSTQKQNRKYWNLFPHYMNILQYLLEIASGTNNTGIQDDLAQILQKLIDGTANNQDITPEQLAQLYQNLYENLKKLIKTGVNFDISRVRRQAEKIPIPQIKQKIIQLLKTAQNNQQITIEPQRSQLLNQTTIQNKYQSKPKKLSVSPGQEAVSIRQNQNASRQQRSMLDVQAVSQLKIQVGEQLKKRDKIQNIQNVNIDTHQILNNQETNVPNQSSEQLQLLNALKLLKKIIKKQQPKSTFPKLIQIFMKSQFNKNRRYILGHLLTEYYQKIEKDQKVIGLLQLKDKTNLSKQICYGFLKKFEEVFIISKRWKLIGKQFIDLAMSRLNYKEQINKLFCIQNGCEIAEYNLIKTSDLNYFENKKYHCSTADLFKKVTMRQEAAYYLLLIGTSARLLDIKMHYIKQKLHGKLMDFLHRKQWIDNSKIIANLSYALSSLCYTQNHIAIQIVRKKPQMLQLFSAYNKCNQQKIVIQSACSLLSNLCYSNKQTKQILYNYGVIEVLLGFMRDNLSKPEISTYKQIMRAMGNTSLHKQSACKLIDHKVSALIVEIIEKFNILIYRDEEKLKVLRLTVDLISNLTTHKYKLENIHHEGITTFIITLIETTEISEDHIMMGCIDTIDGLCQLPQVQNFVVMDKNLPYLLIDLLKVKQDQRLITKTIRLLTNMTINQVCIPYILNANLLSVLTNIVLPVYKNQKVETYVNKILLRIFHKKPDTKLILKSGYLDCLMKSIEICHTIDDNYIDILLHYSQQIPNYLNHRAFLNLVRLLTTKAHVKQLVEKCLRVFKVIFSSEERSDDDILIEDSPQMYEKILKTNQSNRTDILYIIGLHCTKSTKFKAQLKTLHEKSKCDLLNIVFRMSQIEATRDLGLSVLFCILNVHHPLVLASQNIAHEEEIAYKFLVKGVKCKLFRTDGSSKTAIIDLNDQYLIRVYKYPDGEIKKKYTLSIRQIRDWQFNYKVNDDVWKYSVFAKAKSGILESQANIEHCLTLLGSRQWGQFTHLNIQFDNPEIKNGFIKAIQSLIRTFKILA